MKKEQKAEIVTGLQERFSRAQGAVVLDYRGLTVPEIADLRRRLRESGSEMVVAKNTLTRRATDMEELKAFLQGPTALVFGYEDAVAPAKVVAAFMKDHPVIRIRGGLIEGAVVDQASVMELSKLPGREELLAQVVGTLNAPISGLVNVLGGLTRGLVTVLSQIAEQKE